MEPVSARSHRPTSPAPEPIRVLIVDDSIVARAALTRIVNEAPAFRMVAALDGAQRAIDWLGTDSADIILLDIQMPGLDGLAAMPELIRRAGRARIIVVSTLALEGAKATVKALSLGAADTLAKPAASGLGQDFSVQLVEKMRRLGAAQGNVMRPTDDERYDLRTTRGQSIACLAIGASTGGLHALTAFFGELPASFHAPIFVTQHLPSVFMKFFADQLALSSGRHAVVAEPGLLVSDDLIIVAPGSSHLRCVRRGRRICVELSDEPVLSRCCPSVDPMFASVAATYGEAALGMMLTGMGRDGATGAEAICAAGGTIIAQDPGSSAVWGMPGAVVRNGLASLVAAPPELAAYVARCGSSV